jgi:hypothetical protein
VIVNREYAIGPCLEREAERRSTGSRPYFRSETTIRGHLLREFCDFRVTRAHFRPADQDISARSGTTSHTRIAP